MTNLYVQIGQKIRELRGALSQDELAGKLDISPNTISRWETGTYKPTPEDLDKLARIFKVSITVFFPHLAGNDQRINALTSATGGLSDKDFGEIVRYAEFCRVRGAMKNAKRSKAKS